MRRNIHLVRCFAILCLLALSLLPGSQAQERPAQSALPDAIVAPAYGATLANGAIRINEVMPKPGSDQFEWVELYNPVGYSVYLPVVRRDAVSAASAMSPASGATTNAVAATGGATYVAGWQITDEDGNSYSIPEALPVVPRDAYVLIIFDGLGPGADDYDFAEGVAVLHSPPGLVNIFEDTDDQVALYRSGTPSPTTIADFLAWGAPPAEDAANAYAAGLWDPDSYATFQVGGVWEEDSLLPKNESLGRYPGSTGFGPQGFALYQSSQLSPGALNPVPLPDSYTPGYGAIVETANFSFSWNLVPGATAYGVQLDNDSAFGSPLYETTVTDTFFKPPSPLSAGTYYWRVKPHGAQGEEGPWMAAVEVGIVDFGTMASGGLAPQADEEVVLGIAPLRQNKDTNLLCLDGDSVNEWDRPAPCTVAPCVDYAKLLHGMGYCSRASIRMMASHYGGSLSMDRISYYYLEEWEGNVEPDTHDGNPNNDLGHRFRGAYDSESTAALSWALGVSVPMLEGKPGFDVITATLGSGAPIMFEEPGHMMVMDGYKTIGEGLFVRVLDPDLPPDLWHWQEFNSLSIAAYRIGPASAPDVRSDEYSVWADGDSDGIMDFDEANRFATGVDDIDTDGDARSDKTDIREYAFGARGEWNRRNADYDGDLQRMEVDYDSDNGGSRDGCEDTNRNGIFEPALEETSNWDPGSEKECVDQPPSPIVNLTPPDGATGVPECIVQFSWSGGVDPDGDAVEYYLELQY